MATVTHHQARPRRENEREAATTPRNGDSAAASLPVFVVSVSLLFLIVTFTSTIILAFVWGRVARIYLFRCSSTLPNQLMSYEAVKDDSFFHTGSSRYLSKKYDSRATRSSTSVLMRSNPTSSIEGAIEICAAQQGDDNGQCLQDVDEQEHFPAGQHLMVDMKGVDGEFLNSQEQLGKAIMETVEQTGSTLLSYHCYCLNPSGVSCVGVMLESHIALHTWPSEGVLTLDLFTCGPKPLVPVLPIVQRLFGVSTDKEPTVSWSHKLRGFRDSENKNPLQSWDFGRKILEEFAELKEEILSAKTKFQQIDVYDVMPSPFHKVEDYYKSLANDDSYQSRNKKLYLPNRILLLDGIMQSSRRGEASYHEALVHPAMMAHDNPQRVAIIGGGECATLREVLKHKTVEAAIMVEIDEELVNLSREYLPDWSDCSDLIGSAACCIDDERTNMYYEDAIAWFIDRFYSIDEQEPNFKKLDNGHKMDVIIMDALDPEDEVVFADALYHNANFLQALYDALAEDGILVMQLGASELSPSPPSMLSRHKTRAILIQHLEGLGFPSMHVYEEAHSGFGGPWTYLVALKSYETRMRWYANEAEIEVAIYKRTLSTKSGKSPFQYFDGATMVSYQQPHRSYETIFCKQKPTPEECDRLRGFDPNLRNAPISWFEVKKSEIGEPAGRGLFAKADIAAGMVHAMHENARTIRFNPFTLDLVYDLKDQDGVDALDTVYSYMYGYGYQSGILGGPEVFVESSISLFVNHGCNGTYNLVDSIRGGGLTELTADPKNMPSYLQQTMVRTLNPVMDRHIRQFQAFPDIYRDNVAAGEEVLANYLEYTGVEEDWEFDVRHLRAMCNGTEAGEVTNYERRRGVLEHE